MSSFKDAVQEDLNSVFLNLDEFAETHTVYYDGEEYSDIPIVMTGLSEKERVRQSISDHAEGIYRVSRVLHCDIAAIGGKQPEQGCKLGIQVFESECAASFGKYKDFSQKEKSCPMSTHTALRFGYQ